MHATAERSAAANAAEATLRAGLFVLRMEAAAKVEKPGRVDKPAAIPGLLARARKEFLAAARSCADAAVAAEFRQLAQRCAWIVEDLQRDVRRQAHGW